MKSLIWSAGKFVYPKGSSLPVHFMPLQDFSLEISLNYSLLIALRVARTEKRDELLSKIEVGQWRHRLLTEEVINLIKACKFDKPRIHDFGSDYALLFEELKLARADIGDFDYVVHLGDHSHDHPLAMLHPAEDWPLHGSHAPLAPAELDRRSVVIVNTVLGFRPQHDAPSPLSSIHLGQAQGCILALRACEAEAPVTRTTIHGEDAGIPTLASVQRWMGETGLCWHWRWLPRHDVDYFIPEPDAPDAGVLLAYAANAAEKRPGFRLLTKKETANG